MKNKSAQVKLTDIQCENPRRVHPALRPYLGYCMHKLSTIFRSELSSAFKKQNIQGAHFAILSIIEGSKNAVNQVNLCDETGIDKASMVKIIDHLEKLKYIERVSSTADRRIKNLSVTKSGIKFLKESILVRNRIEEEFLSALTPQEVKSFKDLVLKLLDHQQG